MITKGTCKVGQVNHDSMWVDKDKPWNRFIKRGGDGRGGSRDECKTLPIPNRTRRLYPQSFSVTNTGNPSQLV